MSARPAPATSATPVTAAPAAPLAVAEPVAPVPAEPVEPVVDAAPAAPAPAEPAPAKPASVEPESASDAEPAPVDLAPGPLAAAAAIVPGILVHGTGHLVAGDRRTARRLLIIEGIALAGVGVAGATLGLTGAARRVSLPSVPLLVSGCGLFLLSAVADLYGAAGGSLVAGTAPGRLPGLETRLGYVYVHDPRFVHAHFTDVAAHLRRGAWRAGVHAQLATETQHVRTTVEHRLRGPRQSGEAPDGTALDLQAGLLWQRYGADGFDAVLGELLVVGRYDLARFSPSLAGAFVDMGAGLGLELTAYDASMDSDVLDRLLMHFSFGMYLGAPGGVHGEVRVGYDHRRDGLVGGLAVFDGSDGFIGSFGADSVLMLHQRWGLAASLRVGSAYVTGANLVYRQP